MEVIRTILVEDEPLARAHMERVAKSIDALQIIGSYSNPKEAQDEIEADTIDLILSDIQMPEMDGITFIKSLKPSPLIIFITAHAEYAVDCFELDVVDYILKPLEENRLKAGITKVKRALSYYEADSNQPNYIKFKDRHMTSFFKPSDMLFIQAWGDYVKIHTKEGITTLYYTMKELENIVPEKHFVRIHRSYIVNIDYVGKIDATKVILTGTKETLPVGLQYRDHFFNRMGKE